MHGKVVFRSRARVVRQVQQIDVVHTLLYILLRLPAKPLADKRCVLSSVLATEEELTWRTHEQLRLDDYASPTKLSECLLDRDLLLLSITCPDGDGYCLRCDYIVQKLNSFFIVRADNLDDAIRRSSSSSGSA